MDSLDPTLAPYADWPVKAGDDAVWCDKADCRACAASWPGDTAVSDRILTPRRLLEGIRKHAEGGLG